MYPETPTCWPASTDPHTRNGLTTAEQEWVEGALQEERASINAAHGTFNPFRALVAPRHAAVGPHMALYRAVESRPVMAAAMMTRECVGRKSI
jgi:hypothetical protein